MILIDKPFYMIRDRMDKIDDKNTRYPEWYSWDSDQLERRMGFNHYYVYPRLIDVKPSNRFNVYMAKILIKYTHLKQWYTLYGMK